MRGTAILNVSHGQYYIGDSGGDLPTPPSISDDDTIVFPGTADTGGALVATGTFWGPVEVTVETSDLAPVADSADGSWEKTEQVELVALGDGIQVFEPEGMGEGLPLFPVTRGQRYHVRVAVRGYAVGKNLDADDIPSDPVEFHRVQMWSD